MMREQAETIVYESIAELFRQDALLLTNDVSERAITHKLAEYMRPRVDELQVPNISVDCEYNRNVSEEGELDPKTIWVLRCELATALRAARRRRKRDLPRRLGRDGELYDGMSTAPDIIVHERGHNERNLLIVEAKKSTSNIGDEFDRAKLRAFTDRQENEYRYTHGVFVRLPAGPERQLQEYQVEWFSNGQSEGHLVCCRKM
jgi:hypothetical protein